MNLLLNRQTLLLIACVSMASAVKADLIVNGGFETPPITPNPFGYNYRTGSDLTGWTITTAHGGIAQFDSTYRPVGAGSYSIQIESGPQGVTPGDTIAQTFATTVGQTYRVSFLLSAYDSGGASMNVDVGGAPLNFTASTTSYIPYSFDFVASSLSTTLTLANVGVYAVSYPQVDSVSVTAVPEPSTMIAGGFLLLPLAFRALRRFRS